MKVQEIILSDFRTLCRYARESSDFKPISKLHIAYPTMSDNEYRDVVLDAMKYYFGEKDYKKYVREEMKLDEEEMNFRKEAQSEVVEEKPVEKPQESSCTPPNSLV